MWRKLNVSTQPGWICLLALCTAVLLAACSPNRPAGLSPAEATTVAASVAQATVGAIATEITSQTQTAAAANAAAATTAAKTAAAAEAAAQATKAAEITAAATSAPDAASTPRPASETPANADAPQPQGTPTTDPAGIGIPDVLKGLDTQLAWGISPDRAWFWAFGKGERVGALTQVIPLVLRSADGQTEWRISLTEEDLYGNQYIDAYYMPFFWLPAEPYVYLVSGGYGDDQGAIFSRNQNLVRLNLTTGKLEPQVIGAERHYYRFAANGAYYLDAPQGSPLVRIHRLVDGRETRIELHNSWTRSGNALFSVDNRQVVVQSWQALNPCENGLCQRSPLILIDVETGEYRVLLADLLQSLGQPQMVFPSFTWLDASHLRISIGSPQMGYSQWKLDTRSNALTQMEDAPPEVK